MCLVQPNLDHYTYIVDIVDIVEDGRLLTVILL